MNRRIRAETQAISVSQAAPLLMMFL